MDTLSSKNFAKKELKKKKERKKHKLQKATKESEWLLLVWSKSKQTKYNAQQQTVFI